MSEIESEIGVLEAGCASLEKEISKNQKGLDKTKQQQAQLDS
jgi:hypothetical protein